MIYWKKDRRYLRKMLDSADLNTIEVFITFFGNANVGRLFPAVHLRKNSVIDSLEAKDISKACERVEEWIIQDYNKPLFEEVEL